MLWCVRLVSVMMSNEWLPWKNSEGKKGTVRCELILTFLRNISHAPRFFAEKFSRPSFFCEMILTPTSFLRKKSHPRPFFAKWFSSPSFFCEKIPIHCEKILTPPTMLTTESSLLTFSHHPEGVHSPSIPTLSHLMLQKTICTWKKCCGGLKETCWCSWKGVCHIQEGTPWDHDKTGRTRRQLFSECCSSFFCS